MKTGQCNQRQPYDARLKYTLRYINGVSAHIWSFSNFGLAVYREERAARDCICAKVYLLFSHLCFLGSSEASQKDFITGLTSYEIITILVHVESRKSVILFLDVHQDSLAAHRMKVRTEQLRTS